MMNGAFPAYKVYFPGSIELGKLPVLIKAEQFRELCASCDLVKEVEEESKRILAQAREEALRIVGEAEASKCSIENDAYESGVERVQMESVQHMASLSSMSSKYMCDYENSLVDIVVESVKKIIYQFDDRELVENTIRKASDEFGPCRFIDLWVSSEMSEQLDSGISDLLSESTLTIRTDSSLSGSQCRLDNGRMVLLGDSSTQVEALRLAMQSISSS